jgi:uncharacterized protein YbjT (DUF2867 family)
MRAFVAGATGYVGNAVVRLLRKQGIETIAHIRPDSSRLQSHRAAFEEIGATVDTTAWDLSAMQKTMGDLKPDLVFCCIGTTRKRKQVSDTPELETYDAVDYGLTALLVRACVDAEISPRFVYISSVGTQEGSPSSYIQARWKAEQEIIDSGLPYTIARPSFIAGPNRPERRVAELASSVVSDLLLAGVGLLGFTGLRDKFKSMTDVELASALIALALDDDYAYETVDGRVLHEFAA